MTQAQTEVIVALIMSLAICMLVIPVMIRLAPRLGMVDRPNARKVHAKPIARVGGWGIAVGALVPVALLLPLDTLTVAYLLASALLVFCGMLDDTLELGHYFKFLGQFVAVAVVVYWGGLRVENFPFLGLEPLPAYLGEPFTVIAMVGMINATNHSDGLDGLAGGETLLSIVAMGVLALMAGGDSFLVVAIAVVGGVLGFLRFNTHPAQVFMGDVGSQFLGFTVGFMAVVLTQQVNPAMSPMAAALLLGLPVVDILAVLLQRAYHGMNWFRASRNHIHHRLLDLGFAHHEAVIVIYSVQALLVCSGVVLCYESDALLAGIYVTVCGGVFVGLHLGERRLWRRPRLAGPPAVQASASYVAVLARLPRRAVALLVPLSLIIGAARVDRVPADFAVLSGALLAAVGLELAVSRGRSIWLLRAALYAASAFVVYLGYHYSTELGQVLSRTDGIAFALLAVAVTLAIRHSRQSAFVSTPMDHLALFMLLAVSVSTAHSLISTAVGLSVIKTVVLLYGCEFILTGYGARVSRGAYVGLLALIVLGLAGLRG